MIRCDLKWNLFDFEGILVTLQCCTGQTLPPPRSYSIGLETDLRRELFIDNSYSVLQRPSENVIIWMSLTILTVNDLVDLHMILQESIWTHEICYDWFSFLFLFLVFYRHFQQYISYTMANSFSGGRSRSTQREPLTMVKQLVKVITCGCESSASFFVIYKAGREPTPYWW